MTQPTIWAVVPAAGIGARFAADRPKQYLELAGRPIAERTLNTLESSHLFAAIVVAVNQHDHYFDTLPIASRSIIEKVSGGVSRAESVLNGLNSLSDRAQPHDWVMVHDIARPLVTIQSLYRLRDAVGDGDIGAILAARVHDTVKEVDVVNAASHSLPLIHSTLDRQRLWLAQTPQMMRYDVLCEALSTVSSNGLADGVTDEASAIERLGEGVVIVENTQKNIKITTPDDLQMAEFYLSLG